MTIRVDRGWGTGPWSWSSGDSVEPSLRWKLGKCLWRTQAKSQPTEDLSLQSRLPRGPEWAALAELWLGPHFSPLPKAKAGRAAQASHPRGQWLLCSWARSPPLLLALFSSLVFLVSGGKMSVPFLFLAEVPKV